MAKYFSDKEVAGLSPRLILMLDQLRAKLNEPITITCGLRTQDKNCALGTVGDSAHLTGLAVDLHLPDSGYRFRLVKAALAVGFVRIGDETAHIHLDIDETKPQNVLWVEISK